MGAEKREKDWRVHTERLLRDAVGILAAIKQSQMEIRDKSKNDYGRLLDGHMIATGLIAGTLNRTSLQPGKTNDSVSHRLTLIASFVQGIDITETAISEGHYVQAAALLKQEMETIAAIAELVAGDRKNRKTPNVRNVTWGLSSLYGDLNRFSHVADQEVLDHLYQGEAVGEARPTSILPAYNKQIARSLYALQVSLIVQAALALDALHREMYDSGFTEDEYLSLLLATDTLKHEGFLGNLEEATRISEVLSPADN